MWKKRKEYIVTPHKNDHIWRPKIFECNVLICSINCFNRTILYCKIILLNRRKIWGKMEIGKFVFLCVDLWLIHQMPNQSMAMFPTVDGTYCVELLTYIIKWLYIVMPYSCISTRSIYDVPFGPTTDFLTLIYFQLKTSLLGKRIDHWTRMNLNFYGYLFVRLKYRLQ